MCIRDRLEIELEAVIHLRRRVGELPRIRQDQADLDRVLGMSATPDQGRRERGDAGEQIARHRILPVYLLTLRMP